MRFSMFFAFFVIFADILIIAFLFRYADYFLSFFLSYALMPFISSLFTMPPLSMIFSFAD